MAAINSIAFKNLRAEMSRKAITIGDIAYGIGMNRDRLSRKLSMKAPLFLDEAFAIKKKFFPDLDIGYLFYEALTDKSA